MSYNLSNNTGILAICKGVLLLVILLRGGPMYFKIIILVIFFVILISIQYSLNHILYELRDIKNILTRLEKRNLQ